MQSSTNVLMFYGHTPYIVKQYNSYMDGIDKLDMMSALYKSRIKSRRWYMYIWLHSGTIVVVNACLLYRRDQSIYGAKKTLKLRDFRSQVAKTLRHADKEAGRPSLSATGKKRKLERKQTNVTIDIRTDVIDHMLLCDKKRNRCQFCKDNKFSYIRCIKCNV